MVGTYQILLLKTIVTVPISILVFQVYFVSLCLYQLIIQLSEKGHDFISATQGPFASIQGWLGRRAFNWCLFTVIVIIDAWLLIKSLSCYFYSKLLEDATSENEKLTEILQVKDETERKQAGA